MGQVVHLTLDPQDRIVIFRRTKDMASYAKALARGRDDVTEIEATDFLFFRKVTVTVDGRGRIAIPEDLRLAANLDDKARLIPTQRYVCLGNPGRSEKLYESVKERLLRTP